MIDAEMKNKVPKLETWEDILTSNVFGLLEIIEYKHLLQIASKAKNHQGDSIQNNLTDKHIKNVELWKNFQKIGEPDVLVTLDNDTFFIIEIKYFSHEHNKKEQIIEEDENLEDYNEKGQLKKYLDLEINGNRSNFIIYLTADYQSLNHIQNSNSTSKECMDNIYHIHWNDFNEHLIKVASEGIEKRVVDKIITYLNFKGFAYWEGFYYREEYNMLNTNIGSFYAR